MSFNFCVVLEKIINFKYMVFFFMELLGRADRRQRYQMQAVKISSTGLEQQRQEAQHAFMNCPFEVFRDTFSREESQTKYSLEIFFTCSGLGTPQNCWTPKMLLDRIPLLMVSDQFKTADEWMDRWMGFPVSV